MIQFAFCKSVVSVQKLTSHDAAWLANRVLGRYSRSSLGSSLVADGFGVPLKGQVPKQLFGTTFWL